jgi:aminocarboxymuconate-semialdehyde decarboxylase
MPSGEVVTDVHAHALIAEVEDLVADRPGKADELLAFARQLGPESTTVTVQAAETSRRLLTELDARLAAMDAASIEVQVVSPSPTQYNYWADTALAKEIWIAANEGIARLCRQAPHRLTAVGLVPLQHPELTVEALEHAVLTCGLKGIEISSFAPSGGGVIDLSHPGLDDLWTRAEELGALVFLHPLGSTVEGRFDRWYLSNIIGQPLEHTIALSHLIFSGVFDRHPSLKLLAAHGGGYLPTYLGRSDHAWHERAEARTCRLPPSHYLSSIFVDSLVYAPDALRALLAVIGAEQVLLGTDFPFDMGITDPLPRLDIAGLAPADRSLIAGGNAARLNLTPRSGAD